MNQAIANIIKGYIDELTFVDKIAGLVSIQYMTMTDEGGAKTTKSYPVACCVTADDCKQGAYNDLTPNSAYKTVLYFEDGGVSVLETTGRFKKMRSRLRLVCWINVAKLYGDACATDSPCTASTNIIIEIIRALPEFPVNYAPFMQVKFDVLNQLVRSNSIFSQYTYNEKQSQYLMSPYDYFSLDIETTFSICLDGRDTYAGCSSS
jgi:hypothetical protein